MITQARLKEILEYDPGNGFWTYKVGRGHMPKGSIAGKMNHCGYRVIMIDGRCYLSPRLAFLFMTGSFPTWTVDHIDTDRANDRWDNLREATLSQNGANKAAYRNNTSGIKGVSRKGNGWRAQSTFMGKKFCFPTRPTAEEAALDYASFVGHHHGQFARTS